MTYQTLITSPRYFQCCDVNENPANLSLFLIRYMGPHLRSKLPKDIRNANSFNSFKTAIRNVDFSILEGGGCKSCYLCNRFTLLFPFLCPQLNN